MKTAEDLGEALCDLCPLDDDQKQSSITPGGMSCGCEGSRCDEAYENYLDYRLQCNFSEHHVNAILKVAESHPELIFCGSTALVIAGKIDRKVHDIDILHSEAPPLEDMMKLGFYYNSGLESSNQFNVGKDITIQCIKLRGKNEVDLDFFEVISEKGQEIDWHEVDFFGKKIKVQKANDALNVKIEYVKTNPNVISVLKHMRDLLEAGVGITRVVGAIDVAREKMASDAEDNDFLPL